MFSYLVLKVMSRQAEGSRFIDAYIGKSRTWFGDVGKESPSVPPECLVFKSIDSNLGLHWTALTGTCCTLDMFFPTVIFPSCSGAGNSTVDIVTFTSFVQLWGHRGKGADKVEIWGSACALMLPCLIQSLCCSWFKIVLRRFLTGSKACSRWCLPELSCWQMIVIGYIGMSRAEWFHKQQAVFSIVAICNQMAQSVMILSWLVFTYHH